MATMLGRMGRSLPRTCFPGSAQQRLRPLRLSCTSAVNAHSSAKEETSTSMAGEAVPHIHKIQDATQLLSSPFYCSGSAVTPQIALCCPASGLKTQVANLPVSETQLKTLMNLCVEATFGKGMKNVQDPSYRKALALSTDKFFTDFNLSAYDILSTVKNAMMPDATSVTAQLYKLNIYRPGDFFKSHVDTPRGDGMFGSLVVCLPQPHTGGALLVRHKGQEQRFDFAAACANTVQWAAFYSDCEHEILPVETGHRITLTYNLYCTKGNQANGPHLPGLDVSNLSLYKQLAEAVADPHFMAEGGDLAFGCEHAYPHTVEGLCSELHTMLKGRDALCYKVLQQLGFEPAVMAAEDWTEVHDFYKWEGGGDEYGEDEHADEGEGEDGQRRGGGEGRGKGGELQSPTAMDEGEEGQINENLGLHEAHAAGVLPDWGLTHRTEADTGDQVMWVCKSNISQVQWYTSLSYGNEATVGAVYSSAVIVAFIPKWDSSERWALLQRVASGQE